MQWIGIRLDGPSSRVASARASPGCWPHAPDGTPRRPGRPSPVLPPPPPRRRSALVERARRGHHRRAAPVRVERLGRRARAAQPALRRRRPAGHPPGGERGGRRRRARVRAEHRTPVALRSGGHSYTGWSAGGAAGTDVPRSLVISTPASTSIALSSDGGSVTIGPGAKLLDVYERLASAGRAIGAGSCATVGIGGLTLGGGVGVLVRSFGLTCDQLTGATLVTADGGVHEVSAQHGARPVLGVPRRRGGDARRRHLPHLPDAARAERADVPRDLPVVRRRGGRRRLAALGARRGTAALVLPQAARRIGPPVRPRRSLSSGPGRGRSRCGRLRRRLHPGHGRDPARHTASATSYGAAMRGLAGSGARVSESATSSIGTTAAHRRPDRHDARAGRGGSSVSGMTEGGVSLDALGGAVSAGARTPRSRGGRRSARRSTRPRSPTAPTPRRSTRSCARSGRRCGRPGATGAYANYCDAAITDPTAYSATNTARLHAIAQARRPARDVRATALGVTRASTGEVAPLRVSCSGHAVVGRLPLLRSAWRSGCTHTVRR